MNDFAAVMLVLAVLLLPSAILGVVLAIRWFDTPGKHERNQIFADGVSMGRAWEHAEMMTKILAIPDPPDEFTQGRLAKTEAPGSYPDAS